MIITLKGADFSKSNVGTLSTWLITKSLKGVTTTSTVTSVDKDGSYTATFTVNDGYIWNSCTVTMGGTDISSMVSWNTEHTTGTITISKVTGNVYINIVAVSESGEEPDAPTDPIAYYAVNKNLWSDGEIQDSLGRIAITTYFPTDGKELSVSTSITEATTIAKRYYDANKTGGVAAAESVYGRPVLVLGTTALTDIYAGETITVNGTVYTLQVDPAHAPKTVSYLTQANIGADGAVIENYSEFRVAILDYFETGGAAITASSSLGGTAIRYYDADKNGGATATTSTYARVVIYGIDAANQNDAAVEGSGLTVNGVSYTLSNN